MCQVQVESLRQELSDKQSLLSEAGEAIEQLETKIRFQEDLSEKVIVRQSLKACKKCLLKFNKSNDNVKYPT